MSDTHHNKDNTKIVSFRVPVEYQSKLDNVVSLLNVQKNQWLIGCINRDLESFSKNKELIRSISNFKDSIFFLKAYTTLDRDRTRARKVLKNLDELDKSLSDILSRFS